MRKVFLLLPVCGAIVASAEDFELPPTKGPSAIIKLDNDRVKIGNVLVDGGKGQISFSGKTVEHTRELEVFASSPNGRTYEGLISCDVQPIDVATGLRLLGLEGGGGVKFQGDPTVPKGDSVEILVEWTDAATKKVISVHAEDMIIDAKNDNHPIPHLPWIHVGSRWDGKRFMAQVIGDLITLEHFPDTIIENPLKVKKGDYSYQPNPAVVPPVGTELTLIIKVVKKAAGK